MICLKHLKSLQSLIITPEPACPSLSMSDDLLLPATRGHLGVPEIPERTQVVPSQIKGSSHRALKMLLIKFKVLQKIQQRSKHYPDYKTLKDNHNWTMTTTMKRQVGETEQTTYSYCSTNGNFLSCDSAIVVKKNVLLLGCVCQVDVFTCP